MLRHITNRENSVLKIRNGNLSNLNDSLSLIRKKIPEKSNISLEEIFNRLEGKDYHIKIAEKHGRLEGIFVWYGPYKKKTDCYMWLGVARRERKHIGSLLMKNVIRDMKLSKYNEVYVKTKISNPLAIALLKNFSFKPYTINKRKILFMKKELIIRQLNKIKKENPKGN